MLPTSELCRTGSIAKLLKRNSLQANISSEPSNRPKTPLPDGWYGRPEAFWGDGLYSCLQMALRANCHTVYRYHIQKTDIPQQRR